MENKTEEEKNICTENMQTSEKMVENGTESVTIDVNKKMENKTEKQKNICTENMPNSEKTVENGTATVTIDINNDEKNEFPSYVKDLFDLGGKPKPEFNLFLYASGNYENNWLGKHESYTALKGYFSVYGSFPTNPTDFYQLCGFGLIVSKFKKNDILAYIVILEYMTIYSNILIIF